MDLEFTAGILSMKDPRRCNFAIQISLLHICLKQKTDINATQRNFLIPTLSSKNMLYADFMHIVKLIKPKHTSLAVILKSAGECPGTGNNVCRIGILFKSNICRNYNGI